MAKRITRFQNFEIVLVVWHEKIFHAKLQRFGSLQVLLYGHLKLPNSKKSFFYDISKMVHFKAKSYF